jgi:hypothetical protein
MKTAARIVAAFVVVAVATVVGAAIVAVVTPVQLVKSLRS